MATFLTVHTLINAPVTIVWQRWINTEDIKQWNNPSDEWHTLSVVNDVVNGGKFDFRMETKDGSAAFNYVGKYDKVIPHELIELTTNDERVSIIKFEAKAGQTLLTESFQPEEQTPIDLQREFCQGVIDTFKKYVEGKK